MVVTVRECITEGPSRILPFLRDSSVYIHAVGLCRGCHIVGCGGEWFGLGMLFCAKRSVGMSFAIVGGGVRGMLGI